MDEWLIESKPSFLDTTQIDTQHPGSVIDVRGCKKRAAAERCAGGIEKKDCQYRKGSATEIGVPGGSFKRDRKSPHDNPAVNTSLRTDTGKEAGLFRYERPGMDKLGRNFSLNENWPMVHPWFQQRMLAQ